MATPCLPLDCAAKWILGCTIRTLPGSPLKKGGFGTKPWWLALLAFGGAYWPLALEPSAVTSRHPHYCGHPHCRGHPHASVGI